ncbi:MAG: alpha/beta fold hydrolase [Gammaproteobacteria bacterium AqS3]|nr:alpha/beta fold hydrolase [Gammaproteobacteria bacterium AqS3]
MAQIVSGGVEIYYEARGSGPAILLSHGYGETSQMWRDQFEALSVHHRLIVWDMRGHGRSGVPEDQAAYTQAATVADMRAILDAEGIDQAVIGGLSLGGFMSLAFHLTHPERVRALMLIDTGPGFKNDEAREGWNRYALKIAEGFRQNGLAQLGRDLQSSGRNEHASAEGLVRSAVGMLTQQSGEVIHSLPEIRAPTLVVVGENDEPYLAASDYMHGKISGSHKVIIPDAAHLANVDQPEIFNREVLGFLEGLA